MKDMPALLLAVLAQKDVNMLARVFDQVVDSGKMLRNFAQIIRSGAVGRKSFGNRPKKLMQTWLLTATEKQLLNAAVGNSPSLADVVKMVHPKPREAWRAAWFAWLIGKPYDREALPPITRAFEDYNKAAKRIAQRSFPNAHCIGIKQRRLGANRPQRLMAAGSSKSEHFPAPRSICEKQKHQNGGRKTA